MSVAMSEALFVGKGGSQSIEAEATKLLAVLEPHADAALRASRKYMKPVARALLLSTFVEDGFRMATQWGDQTAYIESAWGVGGAGAVLFVLTNLVGQLVPTAMVLARNTDRQVRGGIFALAGVLALQMLAYDVLWSSQFFLRNTAVAGSLVLLYAETVMDKKSTHAGLPEGLATTKAADYLQAAGRVMIVIMFLTMLHLSLTSPARMLMEGAELALMGCVAVGKQSKACALLLTGMMVLETSWYNAFWMHAGESAVYDLKKYDFFQTLTVIGGLLLVVACGAGNISMDRKKDF